MAKRTASTPATPRKRATPKKKPNGEIESTDGGIAVAPPEPAGPTADDIRVRAYHRYLERGGNHGADFDDWVEAEKDLKHPRS
jgi:hypothetical protein